MSAAVIDALHWSDVPALVRLEHQIYGADAWSESAWWSELAGRPRRVYVGAREGPGGPLLGYAGLDLGPDVADVMTVTLAPEARGRGLGHVLMRTLVGVAAASEADSLMLEVRSDNEPALALYSAWGFRQISARRGYYSGVDALILRRQIVAADREQYGSHTPVEAVATGTAGTESRRERA